MTEQFKETKLSIIEQINVLKMHRFNSELAEIDKQVKLSNLYCRLNNVQTLEIVQNRR